ncbi:MAG: hypothetical protein IPL79_14890 [Myxococcales bacterium]|nr:hypothetical protein [Myxococcales bacterium]
MTLPSSRCDGLYAAEESTTCFTPGRTTIYYGDSGGPGFVIDGQGQRVQATVTSRLMVRERCVGSAYGAANLSVDRYVPWIMEQLR